MSVAPIDQMSAPLSKGIIDAKEKAALDGSTPEAAAFSYHPFPNLMGLPFPQLASLAPEEVNHKQMDTLGNDWLQCNTNMNNLTNLLTNVTSNSFMVQNIVEDVVVLYRVIDINQRLANLGKHNIRTVADCKMIDECMATWNPQTLLRIDAFLVGGTFASTELIRAIWEKTSAHFPKIVVRGGLLNPYRIDESLKKQGDAFSIVPFDVHAGFDRQGKPFIYKPISIQVFSEERMKELIQLLNTNDYQTFLSACNKDEDYRREWVSILSNLRVGRIPLAALYEERIERIKELLEIW